MIKLRCAADFVLHMFIAWFLLSVLVFVHEYLTTDRSGMAFARDVAYSLGCTCLLMAIRVLVVRWLRRRSKH